jgi:hypothetical protein
VKEEACRKSLTCYVGGLNLLNDGAHADVVDQVLVQASPLHQSDQGHPLQIVRHQRPKQIQILSMRSIRDYIRLVHLGIVMKVRNSSLNFLHK